MLFHTNLVHNNGRLIWEIFLNFNKTEQKLTFFLEQPVHYNTGKKMMKNKSKWHLKKKTKIKWSEEATFLYEKKNLKLKFHHFTWHQYHFSIFSVLFHYLHCPFSNSLPSYYFHYRRLPITRQKENWIRHHEWKIDYIPT